MMFFQLGSCAAAMAALSLPLHAQGAVFQTPGMPAARYPDSATGGGDMSQANRFSSVFNPAFSFIVDTLADYVDVDAGQDGFDADLRVLELAANSWVDPNAWAYFVAASDGESLNIEEAAVHYTGLGANTTLRAGRFFIDFGKQMQTHVHELPTVERPLVLRTYLGDEIKGDGLQFDHWFALGDETVVRWSIGGFSNLLPEEEEDFDPAAAAEVSVDERKSLSNFNYTARLTGFRDIGESGIVQLGASTRFLPSYSLDFEPSGAEESELSNTVVGADATYGWTDATGLRHWTVGGEYLINTGDTGVEIGDAGTPGDPTDDTLAIIGDSVCGWFAFADFGWNPFNSVGLQYSALGLADAANTDLSEIEAYYTRMLSEFHRLRLSISNFESDLADEDSFRVALQYTAILGAHGHGVNW